jgi:hypothetical protein
LDIRNLRRLALSLPEVSEEPHFHLSSFRVKGRIFATVPPDGTYLNVFVDEPQREMMLAVDPAAYQALWWGQKVVGLRVDVSAAKSTDVEELLRTAWERKAPKSLRDQI